MVPIQLFYRGFPGPICHRKPLPPAQLLRHRCNPRPALYQVRCIKTGAARRQNALRSCIARLFNMFCSWIILFAMDKVAKDKENVGVAKNASNAQVFGVPNAIANHAAYDPEPHSRNANRMFQNKLTFGRWERSEGRAIFVMGPLSSGADQYAPLLIKRWNRNTFKAESAAFS